MEILAAARRLWSKRQTALNQGVLFVKWLWRIANSALAITIVSGLIIAGIARSYARQDEATKDLAQRSAKLDAALTELQQRLTYLQGADRTWNKRCNYLSASEAEWETITGTGRYIPTSPSYRGIHLVVVLTEAQRSSGTWDPGYDAARLVSSFSTRPPNTAIWVRGQLDWLNTYVSKRMWALSLGHLPLPAGAAMSKDLESELGIPTFDEIHDQALRHAKELDRALSTADANEPACTPS